MPSKATNLYASLLIIHEQSNEKEIKDIASRAIDDYNRPPIISPERYRRLFLKLLSLREMPSRMEMDEVIDIVQADFLT